MDPAPLPDLLMLGASSTMVPNFSFAATPRRLTSPSPVARSAIVVARIPPGCRLNLYTRCAKCLAGRRVGGNYHHPEASFSRPGRPAKNPTYGTNRCHLDTNKSWWAPDWLSYHTRENNGSAAFPRWRKISSSWRTICSCETPTGLIGRPRRITRTELELSQLAEDTG